MLYVFLSICCSVIVSILLKLAKRYHIDIFQAITWNYSMAIVLTWIFFKPHLNNLLLSPGYIYGLLGILLPSLFVIVAISIRNTGIVRTEIAQRVSLFIPILASFLLFDEKPTVLKIIGITLGFAAILCSIPWKKERYKSQKTPANTWLYLLVVFIGMGIIDILLKRMSEYKGMSFTSSLFMVYVTAFVLSVLTLFYRFGTKKSKFSWPHIMFGWILGVANFGNILFFIKAQQSLSTKPSLVFSINDIGIIVLGSFVGLFLFREKLSLLNKVGIAIAIAAIIIIYLPTHF
jgi:drug/metabolite transporter (DMT)-like permease